MKRTIGALVALFALALLVGPGQHATGRVNAASPGSTLKRLMDCPDTDGSGAIRTGDITQVVRQYGNDSPGITYRFIDDLNADGIIRTADILVAVQHYGIDCPLVDTQVAQATLWALTAGVPMAENAATLATLHYYQASSDVPGQGVHYFKIENIDGTFDPAAPEGLVYQNGRLAAQLYIVNGTNVGWGTHAAASCCPGAEHGIGLEGSVDGPMCSPACSWDGPEGWHLHHYLCTAHVGTPSAVAIPGAFAPSIADTAAHCQSYSGGEPLCTNPVSVTPCYTWGKDVGWMGHLWNWLPNANQVPDASGGMNGRFADCFPDDEGWKAFNCPG